MSMNGMTSKRKNIRFLIIVSCFFVILCTLFENQKNLNLFHSEEPLRSSHSVNSPPGKYTYNNNFSYDELKNEINPMGEDNPVNNYNHHETNHQRQRTPIRILSLGGSITYGAELESRSLAYPNLIVPSSSSSSSLSTTTSIVKNIAVRATGSEYASHCIKSMIENKDQNIYYHNNHDLDYTYVDEDFDVITLEYSLNGFEHLDLLLSRLRMKYPNAIIIYIHLYSPRMMIEDDLTNVLLKNRNENNEDEKLTFKEREQKLTDIIADESIHWNWNQVEVQRANKIKEKVTKLIEDANGVVWTFPLESQPSDMSHLFSHDFHHLNERGHILVAEAIRNILKLNSVIDKDGWLITSKSRFSSLSSGTWGEGDQCYSWFETGRSPLQHKGGIMKKFVKPDKHAHEMSINNGTASITFENKSTRPLPLNLIYMVWTEDKYPRAKITISSQRDDKKAPPITLNPIHPREGMRPWHIAYMSEVGTVQPGLNNLLIDCIEKKEKPFRLIGISMCGACQRLNLP